MAAGAKPKRVTNLLLGKVAAAANERGCTLAEVGLSVEQLAKLAKMIDGGTVSASAGEKIAEVLIADGGDPAAVAEKLNLLAVTDMSALTGWVEQVIADNADIVEQIRAGDKKAAKAFGFLMGQIMKISAGKAPPAEVKKLLESRIQGG